MKRIVLIIILFTGYLAALHGQQESAILDSAVNNIAKQLVIFPQEKIYLQTDKSYYITGEKIFFRAFLLDAFSNKQDTLSRYAYVELINPENLVAQRVKIRRDSTYMFYGAIPLPEDLPQGDYKIRAYTQYMQNQGESSFFSKQVKISDPQILSMQLQTDFQFSGNEKINVRLRFVDAKTNKTIHPPSVTLQLNMEEPITGKPDKDGWIHVRLEVPDKASKRILKVVLANENNLNVFKQSIQIPYPEGDFDVSFYPEGGQLITGQPSNVAFKAVNTHGAAIDIKGEVVDSKGNTVAEFKTIHDGMGEFFINPLLDEHYQAICHSGDRTLRFDLPEAQSNAVALKAVIRDNKLQIAINKPESASLLELYLIIHSRGQVVYAKAWDSAKDFVTFDASTFPSGINHILLLTKDLQIVSERLIFLLNNDQGVTSFQTQQDTYHKREQVQAEIQLKNEKQQPMKGNFSIAVTNDKEVVPDTTLSILSSILLSSELRGQIENPEYYFQKGNKDAQSAADLLMKTHGWTRYAIPDIIHGKLSYPTIPFEQSQEISGTIKSGMLFKPAKNTKVSLLSLNSGFFDETQTDETGRYVFRNFESRDSTKYIIQVMNSRGKGKQMAELYVDKDTFPGIHITRIEPTVKKEKTDLVFNDYVVKADKQYTYENGMRMINLPEVQVRGTYKKSPYHSFADHYFTAADLERLHIRSGIKLLACFPGALVNQPKILIDNKPLVEQDEIPYYELVNGNEGRAMYQIFLHKLNMINIQNIKQVFGSKDLIFIYTKSAEERVIPPENIKPMVPLGYQLPIEFYSPKYDTQEKLNDSKPDLRTTIYWKPNVLTDSKGYTKLDFYTADDPGTYSVLIEGVSEDGKLIHYRGKALITVKE